MRSRVYDGVRLVLVWQIHVRATVAKTELKNPHAGDLEALTEFVYVLRDHAKIFRDEGQVS